MGAVSSVFPCSGDRTKSDPESLDHANQMLNGNTPGGPYGGPQQFTPDGQPIYPPHPNHPHGFSPSNSFNPSHPPNGMSHQNSNNRIVVPPAAQTNKFVKSFDGDNEFFDPDDPAGDETASRIYVPPPSRPGYLNDRASVMSMPVVPLGSRPTSIMNFDERSDYGGGGGGRYNQNGMSSSGSDYGIAPSYDGYLFNDDDTASRNGGLSRQGSMSARGTRPAASHMLPTLSSMGKSKRQMATAQRAKTPTHGRAKSMSRLAF